MSKQFRFFRFDRVQDSPGTMWRTVWDNPQKIIEARPSGNRNSKRTRKAIALATRYGLKWNKYTGQFE